MWVIQWRPSLHRLSPSEDRMAVPELGAIVGKIEEITNSAQTTRGLEVRKIILVQIVHAQCYFSATQSWTDSPPGVGPCQGDSRELQACEG